MMDWILYRVFIANFYHPKNPCCKFNLRSSTVTIFPFNWCVMRTCLSINESRSHSFVTFNEPVMDHMLLGLKGGMWKAVRSVMTPTFSSGKIKQTLQLVKDCAKNLIIYFNAELDKRSLCSVLSANILLLWWERWKGSRDMMGWRWNWI